MLTLILSILILAGLFALGWQIRACGREMKGLGEEEPKTEERKNEKIRKEIEKWRAGK